MIGSRMSDVQLRDEALTIFLAGHETTALALSWTWYLLSLHPTVEAELHAELRTVLGGRAPCVEDLPRLRYTTQVVKEAMRLYPPAWGIRREAIMDYQLGSYTLPAGAQIYMLQYVVHRDPRYWEDAETFKPERWTDDLERRLPRFAYFLFGGGPRLCIGNTFAMMEAVLLVATIAQRYRFSLVSGQTVELLPSITLRPQHGIKMVTWQRSLS